MDRHFYGGSRFPSCSPHDRSPRYAARLRTLAVTPALAAGVAAVLALALPAASASPQGGASATKRCARLAGELVRLTRHYPEGISRRVNASSTPVCFDFTGDGRGDVAFGILSGGTAGATHWAVFRGVAGADRRPSRRYRKVAERFSGSKTRVLRSGGRVGVQTPIYRASDANCCPTGGARRTLYRVERSRVAKVGSRRLTPEEAGQIAPSARGGSPRGRPGG